MVTVFAPILRLRTRATTTRRGSRAVGRLGRMRIVVRTNWRVTIDEVVDIVR